MVSKQKKKQMSKQSTLNYFIHEQKKKKVCILDEKIQRKCSRKLPYRTKTNHIFEIAGKIGIKGDIFYVF